MKLKYLIGAMALPALVASCSDEEFLTEKGDLQANRPMAGEVTLAVTDGSVDSRWTSAGFEAGTDIIGAALMDIYSEGEGGRPVYTLTNNIQTNYKFDYTENGTWESDALFAEGNYFFYMQYNPDMRDRSGLYHTIPATQEIGANGAASRYENQLFLGHYFIEGGSDNLDVPVAMVETYAFPRVAATYDDVNGVVIEKIVAKSSNFILERQLDVTSNLEGVPVYDVNENNVFNAGVDIAANSKLNAYLAAFNVAVQSGYAQNGVPAAVKKAVAAAMKAKSGKTASSITIVPETAAATVDGAFVAPAGTYTGLTAMTFDIYTNKGIVTVTVPDNRKDTKYTYSNEQYAENTPANYVKVVAENFPIAFSAGEGGSSKKFEIFFKDDAIVVPTTLEVATIEELTKYLTNWYTGYDLNGDAAGKGELTVKLTGDIVLNDAVMSFLATSTNPTVKFTTEAGKTITIPATAEASTINTVKANLNVIIAEGATQVANVGNTSAILAAGNIINKGTLTIQANKAAAVTTVASLANMGTLNVNTALNSSANVINGYTVKIATSQVYGTAGATIFNGINEEAVMNVSANVDATVVSYGKLNVETNATITSVENEKVTYAAGTVYAASKTAEMTIDESARLLVAGHNNGKITVDGVLTAVADFENNGAIFNNFGIENKTGVELNNGENGYITVAEDASFTIVYDNDGTIEILDRETEVDAENNKGIILYTADESSTFTVMADDRFNTVKFNEDKKLKVEGTTDAAGVFTADEDAVLNLKALAIQIAARGKFVFDLPADASIAELSVDANVNATIASNVTISKKIEIKSGASIQLNRGYNLYFNNANAASFVNKGTFRNLGNVYAACPEPANFNDINFIGEGYTWLSMTSSSVETTLATITTGTTELTGTTEITAATVPAGAKIVGNGNTLIVPQNLDITGVTIENAVIVVKNESVSSRTLPSIGGTYALKIEGAGNTVIKNCSFESPLTQYDIYLNGSTGNVEITDCKFLTPTAENQGGYGKRAIYSTSSTGSGSLIVTNCEFDDKVYAFNLNETGKDVKFIKCDMKGWLSGYAKSLSFEECTFGKSGEYANVRPYVNATFNKCTFSSEFTLDHAYDNYPTFVTVLKHTFTNCKVAGVAFNNPNDQLLDQTMSETAKSKLSFSIDEKEWSWDSEKKNWALPTVPATPAE